MLTFLPSCRCPYCAYISQNSSYCWGTGMQPLNALDAGVTYTDDIAHY